MIDIVPFHSPSHGNDWTPALNAAIDAATPKGESIQFPAGWLRFYSQPKPMGCGIFLRGDAGITSAKLGTCLVAMYDEPDPEAGFLTWDGSDPRTYKGSGGGISNLTIYKIGDRLHSPVGGTAIKVVCTNDKEHRAGWWALDTVAVLAEDPRKISVWDHIFVADGMKVKREGIRQIWLNNFMCSGARDHVVDLRNVLHLKWTNGEVQGGPTQDPHTLPAGIRITGRDSQNHYYGGVSCWDTLDIQECKELVWYGKAQWIKIAGGGKVKRGIINAVGCDMLKDDTDNKKDAIRIISV